MSSALPRVALHDEEKAPATEADDAEFYADHDELPPVLIPYVLLGYGPRIQLMMLFVRTRRSLTLQEIYTAVDGTRVEIVKELNALFRLGMIYRMSTGSFLLDHSNPVAKSVRDLVYELQREADDMDPEDYVPS